MNIPPEPPDPRDEIITKGADAGKPVRLDLLHAPMPTTAPNHSTSLLPPNDHWVPLLDVVQLLHHPNFYWGGMDGLTNCKYLNLCIDTRDLKCVITDRDNRPVSLERLRRGVERPTMAGMNGNPEVKIEVTPRASEMG